MILITNLSKKYKDKTVIENVNVEFEKNKIHLVMGKNGEGKTSFLKCLLGLDFFSGTICFNESSKNSIFSIFDDTPFYTNLSGFENTKLLLHDKSFNADEITNIGLLSKKVLKTKVKYYSLGERKKLSILLAIFSNANYIIMDEVSNGLDIETLEIFQTILKKLKENSTIIMTGHHIEFYNNVIDRLYIINNKNLLKIDKQEYQKGNLYETYKKYTTID